MGIFFQFIINTVLGMSNSDLVEDVWDIIGTYWDIDIENIGDT